MAQLYILHKSQLRLHASKHGLHSRPKTTTCRLHLQMERVGMIVPFLWLTLHHCRCQEYKRYGFLLRVGAPGGHFGRGRKEYLLLTVNQ